MKILYDEGGDGAMQRCAQCGQEVLISRDLTHCYHCRKQLCPECEAEGVEVVVCKQCIALGLQGKEALLQALGNQLVLWGFQLVERECGELAVRRSTTYQHDEGGVSVTITEALNE
jgi:hypothetical protein